MKKYNISLLSLLSLLTIIVFAIINCSLDYPPQRFTPPLGVSGTVSEDRTKITLTFYALNVEQFFEGYNIYYFNPNNFSVTYINKTGNKETKTYTETPTPVLDDNDFCRKKFSVYSSDTDLYNAAISMCNAVERHIGSADDPDPDNRYLREDTNADLNKVLRYLIPNFSYFNNSKANYTPTFEKKGGGNAANEMIFDVARYSILTGSEFNTYSNALSSYDATIEEEKVKIESLSKFQVGNVYYFGVTAFARTDKIESELSDVAKVVITETSTSTSTGTETGTSTGTETGTSTGTGE